MRLVLVVVALTSCKSRPDPVRPASYEPSRAVRQARPSERFDATLERSPDMEARFAALAQPGGLDRPVECRGRICRVSSGDVDHDRFDAAIRQLTKTAHLNGEELQSRQWPHREIIVYLDFMTDEMATAVDKVGGLGAALRASRPFAACKEQYADRGEVRLTIMSGPPRHLPVESSGGLAATPIGECLRNAMAGLASSLEFAPSVTTVPVHMTFIMRID